MRDKGTSRREPELKGKSKGTSKAVRGTEIAGSVSTMEIGVPQLSCKGTFEVKTLSLNKWIPEEARGARFDVST